MDSSSSILTALCIVFVSSFGVCHGQHYGHVNTIVRSACVREGVLLADNSPCKPLTLVKALLSYQVPGR